MSAHRYCTFCGKRQDEVRHLIASPAGANICNECVGLMSGKVAEADAEGRTLGVRRSRPYSEFRREIKRRLSKVVKLT